MSNIRFSQLPTVVSLKDSDIFAISSPDTSTPPVYTSAQSPISQVAAKIVEGTTFTTSLNTTNKTVAGSINETLSNFANDYSTSSTYAVGDCVLYAGSIYQCTTAIPSGEAWDSTHWTQIKAVDVGSGGGGSSTLDDLTDVDITTPTDGQTLVYDNANSKWVNGQGGGKQTALTQTEYDALVTAGTVDLTMEYFITDGIPAQANPMHNYSTTEQIVGTWIDGSIIYETTFETSIQLPYGSSITSATNLIDISSYNISRVIEFNASTKCNEDKDTHYRTYFNGFKVFIYLDDGSGYFRGYQSLASGYTQINWNTIITIRYTKASS